MGSYHCSRNSLLYIYLVTDPRGDRDRFEIFLGKHPWTSSRHPRHSFPFPTRSDSDTQARHGVCRVWREVLSLPPECRLQSPESWPTQPGGSLTQVRSVLCNGAVVGD